MDIQVRVKAKSAKPGVVYDKDTNTYIVSVRALPIAGLANREVTSLLSAYFKLPVSVITIKRGSKSKFKTVFLNK